MNLENLAQYGNPASVRMLLSMMSQEDGYSDEECAYDVDDSGPKIIAPEGVSLVLARRYDTLVSMPPETIEYTIGNLVSDEIEARSLVRKISDHSRIINERINQYGINLVVMNNFGFGRSLNQFCPTAIAFFKLFEPKPEYLALDHNNKKPMMSVKNAVDVSLVQFLPELFAGLKKRGYEGPRVYIFTPTEHPRMNMNDHFRKLLIEGPIISQLKKMYKDDSRVVFIEGRNLALGVDVLAGKYND